jgi:hypothetical protein
LKTIFHGSELSFGFETSSSSLFANNSQRIFRKKRKRIREVEGIDLLQAQFFIIVGENDRILRTQKGFLEKNCGF